MLLVQEIITNETEKHADGKSFFVWWPQGPHDKDGFEPKYWVATKHRLSAEYTEALELDNFPFDVQHFQLELDFDHIDTAQLVYDHVGGELVLNAARNEFEVQGGQPVHIRTMQWRPDFESMTGNGFHVRSTALEHIHDYEFVGIQRRAVPGHPEHAFCVILQRAWRFYIRKVVLVLIMVSLLSVCVFVRRDDETLVIGDALDFLSTMLLTIVAFMIITKEDLPTLKSPTVLDRYLITILSFVFGLGLVVVLVDPLDYGHWTNPLLIMAISLWLLIHLSFALYSLRMFKRERVKKQRAKQEVDDAKGKDERLMIMGKEQKPNLKYHTNSVNMPNM